ncbi:MAG: hypothetical protein LQ352_007977 [Teloschistes flavicans]|nr:MAG: hypothetical protein LQ352_007977 [Teloschistes flavicans]
MLRCHEKYGDVVRYSPNRLLINSSTALYDIYDHSKPLKKSKAFATLSRILGAQTLLTIIDKAVHRRRRRLINQGFSPETLTKFEPIMVEHVGVFCDQLLKQKPANRDGWTQATNVKDWCNYLAFDIAGDFVFGQNFHVLTSSENRFIIDAILELNRRSGAYAQSPTLARFHIDLIWPPTAFRLLRKSLQWRGFVQRRLQSPEDEKNPNGLFYRLLGLKDPATGEPISYSELLAEAQLLQVAGT